ncbi:MULTISPECIES: hypothetical protein [Chromohalobacter]|uniref:Uncharacterized protein n=1 Tax=Chromohalobacter canadensis TaxID=141389 RepID=A0A285VDZ2_9GAMM|nr:MULTISPECIES: hypothetical protein [Chromohalobacter]MCK0753075.1 hypothetical protein [Chromohalobacter japonicus]SOC52187.1 hypothetical protein SAMN05421509_101551 [Chromohalobacter canadensis]
MIAVLRGFLWLTGVWLAVAVALVVGTLASVLTTLLLLRRCMPAEPEADAPPESRS